jgi:hypothetical protein
VPTGTSASPSKPERRKTSRYRWQVRGSCKPKAGAPKIDPAGTISQIQPAVRPFGDKTIAEIDFSLSEPREARAFALSELWNLQLHQSLMRFHHGERVALTIGEQLDTQVRQFVGSRNFA